MNEATILIEPLLLICLLGLALIAISYRTFRQTFWPNYVRGYHESKGIKDLISKILKSQFDDNEHLKLIEQAFITGTILLILPPIIALIIFVFN